MHLAHPSLRPYVPVYNLMAQVCQLAKSLNNNVAYCHFYPRDAMLARVFAIATCPSVCPPHAGIVPSRAKAGSLNVHHLIAP